MRQALLERKLSDNRARLDKARRELSVLEEQLVAVNEVADDSRLKAIVAETPLASQEFADVNRHVTAMLRSRSHLQEEIRALEQRQEDLIDRIVADARF
jgi:predicted  nucleic acid-binding Zn-ribbon protein